MCSGWYNNWVILGSSLLILFEEGTGNVYFNLLQLILGSYIPYLKKLLEMVSFGFADICHI